MSTTYLTLVKYQTPVLYSERTYVQLVAAHNLRAVWNSEVGTRSVETTHIHYLFDTGCVKNHGSGPTNTAPSSMSVHVRHVAAHNVRAAWARGVGTKRVHDSMTASGYL